MEHFGGKFGRGQVQFLNLRRLGGLVLVGGALVVILTSCALGVTASPSHARLVGKWHHGKSATITITKSGQITFAGLPTGVLIGDQTYAYGRPVNVVGVWDAQSKKPLPTYVTNGGLTDRSLHVDPLRSDVKSWPTYGTNLDITMDGSRFELRFPLGDPDSDAWYTFTR